MEHQLMNPISQLFALIVDELPGCVAPGGRAWGVASESDREYAATEYLFREALNACDKGAQRRLAQKMFGATTTTVAAVPRVTRARQEINPKIQMNLKSLFAQQMILKGLTARKTGTKTSDT